FGGETRRLRRAERRRDPQQQGEPGLRQDDPAMRGTKIFSDEEGKRRKQRQYVGNEFGIRSGEKREHHGAPKKQEALRVETRCRGGGPRAPQRGKKTDGPGQHPAQQHREEEPEGLIAIVFAGEKTLEMLVNEEETEELRVGERNQDEPWGDNREEQQPAPDEVQPRQQPPVAVKEHVGRDRARGQHDPDQTLGHDGEGRGRPSEKHPAAPSAFFGVSLRDGKREYRRRHEKSQ